MCYQVFPTARTNDMFKHVKPSPVVLVAHGSMHEHQSAKCRFQVQQCSPTDSREGSASFWGDWCWRLADQILALLTGQQTVYAMSKYKCICTYTYMNTYRIHYHFRKHLETPRAVFDKAPDAKHLGDGQEHERRVQTVQSQHKAPNCLGRLGKTHNPLYLRGV